MADSELIIGDRIKKISELNQLTKDPLLSNLFDQDDEKYKQELDDILNDNDINKQTPFNHDSIPSLENESDFKDKILHNIKPQLFHPPASSNIPEIKIVESTSPSKNAAKSLQKDVPSPSRQSARNLIPANAAQHTLKRRHEHDSRFDHRYTKIPRNLLPSTRLITNRIPKPKSNIKSLKSQQEVIDENLKEYLSKSISDLEIISTPENYPTETHSVSSLAELYYLTQTLPLIKLLPGCHKTLMTDNFESALFEGKIAVLYSRIEELKRQSKWSLRQPIRYYDPFLYNKKHKRVKSFHSDNLLNEGNWMAADFKESSKFKKSCCFNMAQSIMDYWTYGKIMCIKRKPIKHLDGTYELNGEPIDKSLIEPEPMEVDDELNSNKETVKQEDEENNEQSDKVESEVNQTHEIKDGNEALDSKTVPENKKDDVLPEPDSKEDGKVEEIQSKELPDEESISAIDVKLLLSRPNPKDEIVPPTLPKVTEEDLQRMGKNREINGMFKLNADINDMKKIDQSIIKNLPKFTAFDDDDTTQISGSPFKSEVSPMVSISRLLHPFEDNDDWYKIVLKDSKNSNAKNSSQGPPEYQKGLFGFQSHRRFNYLKPPKPPLIKNIEYRSPTIWLPQDDKFLIHYVAEFAFNWDLISEHLSNTSSTLKKYESNIERRNPWQCFERYIQLNEKFQFSDMKGLYAYHAQQWLEQAHRAQSTTKRRISPLGVGNESIQRGHRRLRWASMFDAMRKSMRKRETQAAKIAQRRSTNNDTGASNANPNTNVNSNGNPSNSAASPSSGSGSGTSNSDGANSEMSNNGAKRGSDRVPTPAELSRLKFERDKSIQEAYMNQQATRSRMMAAVAQQQRQQQQQQQQQRQQQQQQRQSQQQIPPNAPVPAPNQQISPQLQQQSTHQQQVQRQQLQNRVVQNYQQRPPQHTGQPTSQQPLNPQQRQSPPLNPSVPSQGSGLSQQPVIPQTAANLTPQQRAAILSQQRANTGSPAPLAGTGHPSPTLTSDPLGQGQRVPRPSSGQITGGSPSPQLQQSQQQLNVQQQKQQQMRQQAFAQGLAKRPTTPNGTPYTPEQIQQLLQIQKQRRLMQQQQNQAAKTATSAQGNTNLNMQNQYQNKRPVSANTSLGQPGNQSQSIRTNSQSQGQTSPPPNSSSMSGAANQQGQQRAGGQPSKPRIQFAPAQVSAIINSIQTKNPNLTKEQVTRLAATYLANYQQQQQNRMNQQQQQQQQQQQSRLPQQSGSNQQGSTPQPQRLSPNSQAINQQRQQQLASLTPQERNQLQMLTAAKKAQQQALQQRSQPQQSINRNQSPQFQGQNLVQNSPGSPMVSNSPGISSPLDAQSLSKLQYEERKKLLIQKQQQQQQRMNNTMSPTVNSNASSPALSNASLNLHHGNSDNNPNSDNSMN